jgi:Protein of unknown function (DUF1524)
VALLFAVVPLKLDFRFQCVLGMADTVSESLSLTSFDLTPEEKEAVLSTLDTKDWGKGTGVKIITAVLHHLDAAELFQSSESFISTDNFTLEHILPQKPESTQDWLKYWSLSDREKWTHKLGNLCILNQKQNAKASNSAFAEKRKKVYAKMPFPHTAKVEILESWSVDECTKRHELLLDLCLKEFGLGA